MKKRIASLCLCAVLLCALPGTPVLAAADVTDEAARVADYYKGTLAQPGVGDELAMLMLLRGSYINPLEETAARYVDALVAHARADGLAGQTLYQTALQAHSLAAAGLDLERHAPQYIAALSNEAALDAAGIPTQALALLLFSAGGVQAAGGFDPAGYAVQLAGRANDDGGYGEGGSNGYHTGFALAGLATYEQSSEVLNASVNAQIWLQLNSNDYGGFNLDGEESLAATAAAVLGLAALGEDPAYTSFDSAPMTDYLTAHQNDDGTFSIEGDGAYDVTGLCALALVAKQRHDREKLPLFDYLDVVELEYESEPDYVYTFPSEVPCPGPADGDETAEAIPLWMIFSLVLAVLGIVIVVAAVYSGRKKRRR